MNMKTKRAWLHGLDESDVLLNQQKMKVARKEKQPWQIVESLHLSPMVTNYNHHFILYHRENKQVTQLIPRLVQRMIYAKYKKNYPNF
jgi:hypothetical protein